MDSQLLEGVLERTPEINPRVANGLATEQLLGAEQFVDEIFECAAVDFPEGLTYEGSRRCSPNQEFNEATRARDNRQVYELAQSDFYLMEYTFKFHGEELFPRYLYLPYVQTGGLMNVRGKKFAIYPVLADPAFSVGPKSMFIQLTRARLTFERVTHHFMANNEHEATYVAWSWVHSTARNRQRRKSGNAKVIYSTMANYLFVKHGFTEAMREYTGADVVVGEDDINPKDYPPEDWVICSTVGNKPRAFVGDPTAVPACGWRCPKSSTRNRCAACWVASSTSPTTSPIGYEPSTWTTCGCGRSFWGTSSTSPAPARA